MKSAAHAGVPLYRFTAEWIEEIARDANGEWDPDRDKYAVSTHRTVEAAVEKAVRESKTHGTCWARVAVEVCVARTLAGGRWEEIDAWTGDDEPASLLGQIPAKYKRGERRRQ